MTSPLLTRHHTGNETSAQLLQAMLNACRLSPKCRVAAPLEAPTFVHVFADNSDGTFHALVEIKSRVL
ncbi:MAG: hypothetical protein L0Z62_06970, partial [Gemmataceae bacterium]|nr:hypothetical protein [Gemmataceae bacterium]